MPIHIQPASVAQSKYFPKLSLNRRIIFEQLRGERTRSEVERNRREDLNPLCLHAYIFIKKVVKLETAMVSEAAASRPSARRCRIAAALSKKRGNLLS